jgi:formylglycine-generating enzyme required for sulfatase activity
MRPTARRLQPEQRAPDQPPTAIHNKKYFTKATLQFSPIPLFTQRKNAGCVRTDADGFFYIHTQKEYLMKTRQSILYGLVAVVFALAFTACDDGSVGKKTDPTVTWPADLTAVIGQTLAAVPLTAYANDGTPGAFSWTTPSDPVGALGAQSHNMTFTPTDTSKYHTVKNGVNVLVSLAEMVRVAKGTFTIGSDDDQDYNASPAHTVTLTQGFYLGKYEVTQKEYETVMGSLPGDLDDTYGKGDNYPVYYVSWYDALVFCNKLSVKEGLTPAYRIDGKTDPAEWGTLPTSSDATWNAAEVVAGSNGYRLPTEAQWEYACRAGTTTAWHGGDTSDNLGDYAWYSDNNGASGTDTYGTKRVGTKLANAFGLYDMHGNVWEWCWDRYGDYADPAQAETDPVGASSGSYRVGRGGGWISAAGLARSAYRSYYNPDYRGGFLGFRLLRP